ncbi:hypothetical protein [uncultured Actinomyces sp.]|uniref:hypothetical protein n=1 Tax=uncultured Actinomyces sp. TaxID=249061 RepID=UPI0028EC54B4|nr:hypothetical protein [uncultured Actinomyces sp.]
MASYLVMLQTNSNQPFIFSSPRLREQIGASFEITLLSHWVAEVAQGLVSKNRPGKNKRRTNFWVSDSSGKVIVRFTEKEGEPGDLAKKLITQVTRRALTDAPGLDVTGVFIETSSGPVDPADLKRLDRAFSEYSLNRRPAAARFPQFPFLQRAEESALPASTPLTDEDEGNIREYAKDLGVPLLADEEEQIPTQTGKDRGRSLSLPSRVKRAWSRSARRLQLEDVVKRQHTSEDPEARIANLYEDPFQLEKAFQDTSDKSDAADAVPELSSVGVIHIDGNGVGAIMRDLGEAFKGVCCHLDSLEEPAYNREDNPCNIDEGRFQWFVMEVNYRLDGVVKQAVAKAWEKVTDIAKKDRLPGPPVVPVLVGGDDVTVYTDGRYAIPFAEACIHYYEELTKDDDLLSVLAIVAGGKKPDAPERDHFEIGDYIIQTPGPLTASAGVAIVGRNFPFHIAYDLAEELVKRGKKLGKKKREVPCSTINFHVLRDATVLDPEDTLNEYKGRVQRPFLIGHYAPQRIGDATTTSSEESPTAEPQPLSSWVRILQAVAAFDGKKPDDPTQTTGDPFPRARANRIVKLLADYVKDPKNDKAAQAACHGYVLKEDEKVSATQEQIDKDTEKSDDEKRTPERCNHPICGIRLEWTDAQENARGTKALMKALGPLPSKTRLDDTDEDTEDCIEQVRWLLDLIDLSENLPDRYLASRISRDTNISGSAEAAAKSTEGGAQ